MAVSSPAWLPLDLTLAAAKAAAAQGVSDVARSPGQFLDQYRRAQGDPHRLSPYWRRRRDAFVARHRAQLLKADTHPSGWDASGQPTRRHLALAVWAWSPSPQRLRRWLAERRKSNPRQDFADQPHLSTSSFMPFLPPDVLPRPPRAKRPSAGIPMPPAGPPHPRVNLGRILALARREGFDVLYSRDVKNGRIPKDTPVVVSRFIRNRGTEQIAHYRTATSGYEHTPEHVDLSYVRGYFITALHPSEWQFSLNGHTWEGAEGSPMDDLSTRWAAFYGDYGGDDLIQAQNNLERTRVEHAEQTARVMYERQAALRAQQEAGEVGGIKVSRSTGRVRASRQPQQPREPPSAPIQVLADRLIHALRAREGSVIDRGVRILGPNRFKSYFDVLRAAWAELGGELKDLEAEIHRGEIEVLTEEAGLGSRAGRGVGGNRHAALIEYIVHPGLRLPQPNPNPILAAWAELEAQCLAGALRWPELVIDPAPGQASARAHAWCEPGGRCTVRVAPKLAQRPKLSILGVLAHEVGHAYLMQDGAAEHSERDADEAARLLFGRRIRYDADDVQTWGRGVSPRPGHLPQ